MHDLVHFSLHHEQYQQAHRLLEHVCTCPHSSRTSESMSRTCADADVVFSEVFEPLKEKQIHHSWRFSF